MVEIRYPVYYRRQLGGCIADNDSATVIAGRGSMDVAELTVTHPPQQRYSDRVDVRHRSLIISFVNAPTRWFRTLPAVFDFIHRRDDSRLSTIVTKLSGTAEDHLLLSSLAGVPPIVLS